MRPNFGEIAGIENGRDITRGYIQGMGMYIPTQDKILNLKSGGDLDLYETVAQDDRVKSCLQQRFAGLTSKEIEVLPGGDKRIDKQAAEHIKMQLDALNWDNTTEKMQWGVFYGYSVAELLWGKDDDKVIIQGVRVRNRRRFKFGIDQLPRLLSFDNPLGETLPERKFWHFCVGADHDDEPYGRGLAHWLYWLTWFKRNDLRWWITFLENFADPSTVGTYPAGATPAEKATLEGAVRSLGKSKWAIKPEGMLVELVEASRSGTADYEAMYKTINEAISQVILSQNMTTESGSSESQARVHQDVGDSVIEADDALVSGSFNAGPVRWLTEWNFPGAAMPIVQRKLEPEEDLKASAERDKIIVDMGFPANPEYIVEKYGEGFKPIESESTPVALNGAQLQAFVSLISQAQQGGWSPEMVRTSLEISFPHVSDGLLDKMSNSMKPMAAPGADPNNPGATAPSPQTPEQAAQSLDAVAAQFAGAPVKKKNCKAGISCGGSCISALKTCKKALTDEQKQMKEPIVASAGVEVKVEAKTKTKAKPELSDAEKESIAAKVDAAEVEAEKAKQPNVDTGDTQGAALKSKLLDMASGADPDSIKISSEDIEHAKKKFMDDSEKGWVENKVNKMQSDAPSMSSDEANGLSTWIGYKYSDMNAILYGGKLSNGVDRAAVETTDLLAAKALYKLPVVTEAQIVREAAIKKEPFDPKKPLGRYINVPNPEEFVARYQEALDRSAFGQDGIIREPTFFATSHVDRQEFSFCNVETNLTYEVMPKLDGSGNGRYIDHYKNQASEGEVLYPPETRFKVLSVIPPNNKQKQLKISTQEKRDKTAWTNLYVAKEEAQLFTGEKHGKKFEAQFKFMYEDMTNGKPLPSKAEMSIMKQKHDAVVKKEQANLPANGKNRNTNWVVQLQEV